MNLNELSMKNKSSIEWLINQITEDQMIKTKSLNEWLEIFEQAKSMHNEEMKVLANDFYYGCCSYKNFEKYYNEKFGGDNE
jgi:hypothetical protein